MFDVVLVAASQNGWTFPPAVLKKAASLFNGVTAFCDHNPLSEAGYGSSPSVRDVVGVISDAKEKDGYLHGHLHVSPSAYWLSGLLDFAIELKKDGITPPDVGMSADLSFISDDHNVVTEILRVWSVDVVFDPAAGGDTILRALNSSAPSLENQSVEGDMLKFWRVLFQQDADKGGAGGGTSVAPPVLDTSLLDAQKKAAVQSDALLRAQCATTLAVTVGALKLPDIHKVILREQFEGKIFEAAELNAAIDRQTRVYASHIEKDVIKGIETMTAPNGKAWVNGMWTDLDRMQMSMNRLMGIKLTDEQDALAPRLRGIQEAYLLLSGDYNFRGQFDSSRVQFANATTTTMASLVLNAFNNIIKSKWAELTPIYGWYKRVFVEQDFNSLNTVNFTTVGGFGDLPTVLEGAGYTELPWDDNYETAAWLKKGGYIGLTLEMMDRDQTSKARNIPVALATAGIRTLSAKCANILTANGNLQDGTALFHSTSTLRGGDGSTAASGNLSTTALSATEWDVHIVKAVKVPELNSGRRLGLRPKHVIIPIDLEKTALQIFGSEVEPTASAFYSNVRRSGSDNVIVCPEFTDTNDWYSQVDPKIYPTLGVGYRFGEMPEVFTAGEESVGSMFTNDEMRVKVRFFFAAGVIDWRGLRRATV